MKRKCIAMLLSFLLVLAAAIGAEAEETAERVLAWENKEMLFASLYEADITSMRKALDLGLLTCTELTGYYLERIEAYNETYNCFITLCDDAMEVAAQRDADLQAGAATGKLFGIPVVVKDNIDVADWHTTNGYTKWDEQIAEENAEIVDYLLREGAVILGKTNMSTGAEDAYITLSDSVGKTVNAYNTIMASGGSSGGSAVAVSLNFAAAGLGTDTNSSLRYPGALNGCVSLRSTTGRLSLDGVIKLNGTRDVPGVLTRTVQDQAIMLDVLSGGETQYADHLDENALQGMRIGILDEMTYAVGDRAESQLDPEITAAFETAVQELTACGAQIVHIEPQGLTHYSEATLNNDDPALKETVYSVFLEALEEYDVSAVIYPTYVTAPHRFGWDENGTYWSPYDQPYINNCRLLSPSSGAPEITVPLGLHSSGAGIGLEICAPKNEEQLLLNMAYAYMQQYDHRETPSGAENLYADSYIGTLGELLLLREEALQAEVSAQSEEENENEASMQQEETEQIPETEHEPVTAPVNVKAGPAEKTVWVWCAGGAAAIGISALAVRRFLHRKKPRHQRKRR